MKKRILSGLMTLVMALSLLPTAALATETDTDTTVSVSAGPVQIVKTYDNDKLTLEAYLTDEVTETSQSAKPTDIVLVLDQSGSMAHDFNDKSTREDTDTRQYAMKEAVKGFIDEVAKKYDEKTADHRMAIVTFAGGKEATTVADWTFVVGAGTTALKTAITGLDDPSGATNVVAGMTKAAALMGDDGYAYSGENTTGRQKIVIVFTDGVPTTSSYFSTTVADSAISTAKSLKDNGVKIYTIGIFNGTNPDQLYGEKKIGLFNSDLGDCTGVKGDWWQYRKGVFSGGKIETADIAAGNRFLNYLSSNYDASSIGVRRSEDGTLVTTYYRYDIIDDPATGSNQGYYLTASNSESLNGVFQTITKEFSELKLETDPETTVLSDTLSDYFTLNNSTGSDITVEQVKCTNVDASGNYIWADTATPFESDKTPAVTVDGKKITVTGFDYAAKAVTKKTATDGTTSYEGYKLVVTIPIKVDDTCDKWKANTNKYDTNYTSAASTGEGETRENASLSGYTKKNETTPMATELANSPKAPVTVYSVTYEYTYSGGEPTTKPAVPVDEKGYLAGKTASLVTEPTTTTFDQDGYRYTFDGWKIDGEDAGSTFTVNGNMTVTGNWSREALPTTTTYKLTYDANGGKFGSDDTKTESGLEAGSHDLKYSGEYVPTHEKQGDADVYFLGWTTTDTEDKVYGLEDKGDLPEIVSSVTITNSDVTVYAVWGVDAVGKIDGNDDKGDGVPDVYEAKVTYKIVNGVWSGDITYGKDNTDTPISVYFKLYEKQGDTWEKVNPAPKLGSTIPTHSGNPGYTSKDKGWSCNGSYVVIGEKTDVTGSVEYIYYYGAVPALSITKSTTTEKAKVGDEITYTITVKNNGTAAKEDSFTVTDTLPEALTLKAEGTTSGYTENGQNVSWTINGLDAGATTTITVVATVNETATVGSTIKNSAKIGDGEPVPGDGVEIKDDDDDYAGRIYIEKELSEVAPTNQTYTFKVYYKDANGKDVTVGTYEITGAGRKEVGIKQSVVSAASDGIFYVEEVKPADPTGYKLTKIEYAVKELGIEFGGEINDQTANSGMENFEIVPSYSDDVPSVSVNSTVYVRNTYEKTTVTPPSHDEDDETNYYFYIQKVDAETTSKGLKGAKFGLYLDNSKTPLVTATSCSEGYAYFTLDESNYKKLKNSDSAYYKEMTAPEGYVKDDDAYPISYKDFNTSQSKAKQNAEKVLNYRTSTPGMLNDTDHFAYVIGYRDGLVRPYGLITRAETTTIFFRLLKDNVRDNNLRYSNVYTDVPDTYWANIAISTMSDLGIVQGYSDGTFNPYAPITRAQFAAICARFDTDPSVQTGKQTFSDIDGHWAEGYIERAAELGWIKGFEDGTFRPDTYITRAQAMTMINRVLNRIPEDEDDLLDDMNVWPDNTPDMWCYLAVQEATNSHDFKHKSGNYETWTDMNSDPDWTRYEN